MGLLVECQFCWINGELQVGQRLRVVKLEETWGTIVRLKVSPENVPSLPSLVESFLGGMASRSKNVVYELPLLPVFLIEGVLQIKIGNN